MPEFTASDPGSSFPNQNILFNSASGLTGQELQKNQLAIQGQQMDLTAADHEQVGRLAAGLLAEPDLGRRADLYARGVGMLQAQGLAKYAPPSLPDDGVLRSLVSQSLPVTDQYKLGVATPAGTTAAINAALTPGPSSGGTGASATPTGGGGDFGTRLAQSESGGKTSVINQQGYTGTYQFGKQRLADLGYYTPAPGEDMKNNTTWAGKVSVPGFNVTDQQSFAANPAAQQAVFATHLGNIDQAIAATPGASRFDPNGLRAVAHLGGVEGMQKFVASGGVFSPSDANGTSLVAYYNKFSGGAPGGATTATAAPATAQPGQPVPTQVAGPPMVSTAPPGSTAAPGGATQPPAAQAPPAGTTTPSQANLPHASAVPTGANSPQYQQAMDLQRRAMILDAQPDPTGRLKTLAAGLRSQAALALQNDSVVNTQEGQLHTLTGKLDDPAKPLADYHETTPGSGIWVGGPGTEPRFQPPGRLIVTPGGDVYQTSSGGAHLLKPTDPAAVTALEAAKTAGAAAGTATGKLTSQLATQGITAGRAISTIDEGMDQLRRAKASGINTGALAPWLSTYAAVAKSLGVLPLESIGIQPDAVGNIQTAKKTLALVSGQILQQILGPESQVTEGKINQFISATPGIETDPAALERVLNWARAQFVYEREMAAKGMEDASVNNGVLPNNWQAKYYHEHGFAPLYDPTGVGEMKQPDGQAPSREPPASTANAPKALAPPAVGTIKGGYRFKGGDPASQANWERVQ